MTMMRNWLPSFASLYGRYLRYIFSSAGLYPLTVQIDGETILHVWAPTPSKKKKKNNKPSLLLIHGFGPPSTWQWGPQVSSLSRDFDLYVPELVFFGDVSTTRRSSRSEVFQAECVARMMDRLVGPEARYSVAGTSYGGFVAYHMAKMWPERVEKVVVASSALNMTRVDNERLMRRVKEEEAEILKVDVWWWWRRPRRRLSTGKYERKEEEKKMKIEDVLLPRTASQLRVLLRLIFYRWRVASFLLPDFILNDFIQNLYKNEDRMVELLYGVTFGQDDHSANISPLQQDVLILWGAQDQIFSLEKAFELKDLLGEKARLEVMEKTSHSPQLENPRRFNNILRAFLSGIALSSCSY